MKAFSLKDSLLSSFYESKTESFAFLKSADVPSEMGNSSR